MPPTKLNSRSRFRVPRWGWQWRRHTNLLAIAHKYRELCPKATLQFAEDHAQRRHPGWKPAQARSGGGTTVAGRLARHPKTAL